MRVRGVRPWKHESWTRPRRRSPATDKERISLRKALSSTTEPSTIVQIRGSDGAS